MPTDHIKRLRNAGGGRAYPYHGAHINVKKMIKAIRIRQIEPIQYCVRIFMGRHTVPRLAARF